MRVRLRVTSSLSQLLLAALKEKAEAVKKAQQETKAAERLQAEATEKVGLWHSLPGLIDRP